jgi:hypothetical protein
MHDVDLDHLRDMLEEVRGLAQREETEEGDPRGRYDPVGICHRPRCHP